ncbi:MAG TPA: SRPBCC family protein [Roseomonas sp.]|jgi:uncharacterized protein YndB with AHSA1/START domain
MSAAGALAIAAQGDRELVLTRGFDAPRALIFLAMTTPDLIRQWLLGPPGWSMPVCRIDLRPGGAYRYVWRLDDGDMEMGVGGSFRDVVPPARLVHTERFDQAWYPGEAVLTTRLEERDGRTGLTVTILYETAAARDAVLQSPMEQGIRASYDRLDAMLASQAA